MPRTARAVQAGFCYHVLNRGNARRTVFHKDGDFAAFVKLLHHAGERTHIRLLAYCLMPNHFHLAVWPRRDGDLSDFMMWLLTAHVRRYHQHYHSSGHVWQGRFYSCPLDASHLWAALRYTELNPVRAGIVTEPAFYPWSSAAAHCGRTGQRLPLDLSQEPWRECWSPGAWREFLEASGAERDTAALRANTHTGRPLGSPEFVHSLERMLNRTTSPGKGGRPHKQPDILQQAGGDVRRCAPRSRRIAWPAGRGG
jgi:putative transposase